jgi:hypothetical protein
MQLQLVSKEIAIKLQELGFDWKTNWYYRHDFNTPVEYYVEPNKPLIRAPEQALVCKWLREVHKIRIFVKYAEGNGTYNFEIRIPKPNTWEMERIGNIGSKETYEQAEEAGILKAIEILNGQLDKIPNS